METCSALFYFRITYAILRRSSMWRSRASSTSSTRRRLASCKRAASEIVALKSEFKDRMSERRSDNLLLLTSIPTSTANEGTPVDKAVCTV